MSPTDIHYTAVSESMLSNKIRCDNVKTNRGMFEHPVLVWSIALVAILLTVFALISRTNKPHNVTESRYEPPQETLE